MADRLRIHLDEHVDPAVTTTIEADLRTKNDEAHLQFARNKARVIVTRDQDFLRRARHISDHSGIVFYTANQSMREIIEGLILICEVMTPEEMVGRVEYI